MQQRESAGGEKAGVNQIEQFTNSDKKWIVAVKMVSEGVDINRLQVGVYVTNVLQELTFRQIIGRVVRRMNDFDDWAYFYVPLAPRLVDFMKRIKEEIPHIIDLEKQTREYTPTNGEASNPAESIFVTLGTERNPDEDLVISDDKSYNLNDASIWRDRVKSELGLSLNEWEATRLMEMAKEHEQMGQPFKSTRNEIVGPIREAHRTEQDLRKICNKAAYALASQMEALHPTQKKTQEIVAIIHHIWSQKPGNNTQARAGIKELERKLEWLKDKKTEGEIYRSLR